MLDACQRLGVEINPSVIDGLAIIPLFLWYHESFDREKDIPGIRIPSLELGCAGAISVSKREEKIGCHFTFTQKVNSQRMSPCNWSDYYASNPKTPDVIELASWVARFYHKL
ncbi:hypothetical protein RDI58_020240 [Solanum bulbocastanum]|uniref:Uncharacterized protein n=1 Tax=Solanum bulbocastanum TaxID=147425 RepID=A0AAN8T6T5_SOLBU